MPRVDDLVMDMMALALSTADDRKGLGTTNKEDRRVLRGSHRHVDRMAIIGTTQTAAMSDARLLEIANGYGINCRWLGRGGGGGCVGYRGWQQNWGERVGVIDY